MTTSQVDQKRAQIKLKHDLEPFRNAIVGAYGVLTWEKQYYAGIIIGTITIMYLLLWYMDLSFITLFSLLTLLAFFMDFVIPIISRLFSTGTKWDGEQEAKFEEVCVQLYGIKASIVDWYDYMFKERKPTLVVIVISFGLLILAWIGAIINNLFLMYCATVLIAMWPGLNEKDVIKSITQKASKVIGDKINFGKKKLQ